jgi:RNA polymerase sigma factor (TIGR02999 family)
MAVFRTKPMRHSKDRDPNIAALLPVVYAELRRIATASMARMPVGSTLQPTALVHEAWLRLGGSEKADWKSRGHFLAAAAEAMRHILIDRARQRRTMRHGGDQQRVDIEHIDIPIDTDDDERVLAINAAVEKLALEYPQIAELVKLRCFVGLEISEAARVLRIPRATAYRRWEFARTWLYKELHA